MSYRDLERGQYAPPSSFAMTSGTITLHLMHLLISVSLSLIDAATREADYAKLDESIKRRIFQISSHVTSIQDHVKTLGTSRDTHEHREQL